MLYVCKLSKSNKCKTKLLEIKLFGRFKPHIEWSDEGLCWLQKNENHIRSEQNRFVTKPQQPVNQHKRRMQVKTFQKLWPRPRAAQLESKSAGQRVVGHKTKPQTEWACWQAGNGGWSPNGFGFWARSWRRGSRADWDFRRGVGQW